jgi:hypothetical protein
MPRRTRRQARQDSGRGTKGRIRARVARSDRSGATSSRKFPKRRGFGKNRGRTVVGSPVTVCALSLARLEMRALKAAQKSRPKVLAEMFAYKAAARRRH